MKKRPQKSKLVVKEVITPKNINPNNSGSSTSKSNDFLENRNEVGPFFCGLAVVQRKSEDDDYEQVNKLQKKPRKKKKTRTLKKSFWDLEEFQTKQNDGCDFDSQETEVSYQEKTHRLENRLRRYQEDKEKDNRKNRIKQEIKERNFLQQQDNLAETWYELVKMKNVVKEWNLKKTSDWKSDLKGNQRRLHRSNIEISILTKKYWPSNQDCSSSPQVEGNPTPSNSRKTVTDSTCSRTGNEINEIERNLSEKLVFVDEDEGRKETGYRSRRCRQINLTDRVKF